MRVPLALALLAPAHTRSRMISRSILGKRREQVQQEFNLDIGPSALVSMPSLGLRNRTPNVTSSWIERTQCAKLRPQRSNFQTALSEPEQAQGAYLRSKFSVTSAERLSEPERLARRK
jgi:hypothetical protein